MVTRNGRFYNFTVTMLLLGISNSYAAPVDEYTVELYETYCQACHSLEGTGAPLAFDPSKWEKVLSGGSEAAVNNAIKGAGNMPAQGGCMECAYEDFEDLLNYMSQAKPE